jgi:hypothetical protein
MICGPRAIRFEGANSKKMLGGCGVRPPLEVAGGLGWLGRLAASRCRRWSTVSRGAGAASRPRRPRVPVNVFDQARYCRDAWSDMPPFCSAWVSIRHTWHCNIVARSMRAAWTLVGVPPTCSINAARNACRRRPSFTRPVGMPGITERGALAVRVAPCGVVGRVSLILIAVWGHFCGTYQTYIGQIEADAT